MTFAELKAETFRRVREVQDDPRYFTATDIAVSLNDGYMEMSDATEWYEKFQRIEILLNQKYYDMRTVLRSSFLVAGPAFNITTNRWLLPSTPRDLDNGDRRWEERITESERVLIRGLFWVGYWPWKGIASGEIKQYYKALPSAMSENTDTPGFHENFHYGLVEYALFDLFAQDGESTLAWAHWKAYLEYEAKLKAFMDARASVPLVHGHDVGE